MNNESKSYAFNKFILGVTILVFLLLIISFAFREIYSPDIGFHLKAGEWIINNLRVPSQDVFTYTASSHDYLDMHWLYQVIIATINKASGEFGLVTFNAFLIIITFSILFIRISKKMDIMNSSNWIVLFFLAITSASVLFEIRPHIISWLIFSLLLFLLEEYERGNVKYLFIIPLLMLLWTNTHTLFVLGWIIIGAYLIGIVFRDKKIPMPFTIYALSGIAVSIINPYFIRGITLPFVQFQLLQPHNVFKNTIAELTSPISLESYFFNGHFILFQPLMWFHLFLFLSIASLIKRLKVIQLHELIIFGLLLYLAVSSVRNIGFFVLSVTPATIGGFQTKLGDTFNNSNDNKKFLSRLITFINGKLGQMWLNIFIMLLSIILIAAIITDAYYINYRSNDRFGYKFNEHVLPVRAAKFLNEHHLEGKLLNHFNYGGYLSYALPQKVFIDGRTEVIGEELFYKYSILWNQIDKSQILQEYNPDIIIFPHQNDFLWIHYLKKDYLWRLVYADDISLIYLKNGYADTIPTFNTADLLSEFEKIEDEKINQILKSPYPTTSLFSFKKKYFPLKELGLSTFFYYNDQFDEAIQVGLNGCMRSTVSCPELYYNLGHFYFEKRDFERSEFCYDRFLETNDDELARSRLKMIRSGKIQIWQDK